MHRPRRADAEVHTKFEVTWYPPGVMILRSDVAQVGNEIPATRTAGAHVMTPETGKSTHYFFESGNAEKRANLRFALDIFENEDGVRLEDVQTNMGEDDFWELKPLILSNDAGAVLARRVLRRLIGQEIGPAPTDGLAT